MKIFATALFLLAFGTLSAQQNIYEITNTGSKYDLNDFEKAFESANWCRYIYENQRHELKFDDGTIVELLSFKEMQQKLISFDPSCVETFRSSDRGTYKLVDGIIVRMAMKPIKIRH